MFDRKLAQKVVESIKRYITRLAIMVIGIAGGSGSGKSSVADQIINFFGEKYIVVLPCDSYYLDTNEQKIQGNFDHPGSLDFKLLKQHINDLKNGIPVNLPEYDFKTSRRTGKTKRVEPKPIVLVEGILIYCDDEVAELIDIPMFVNAPESERQIRRRQRDVIDRGRTPESVDEQWRTTVLPMHNLYVAPSESHSIFTIHSRYNERYHKIVTIICAFLSIWLMMTQVFNEKRKPKID